MKLFFLSIFCLFIYSFCQLEEKSFLNRSLSSQYPHDSGIEKDPDVLYVEQFEEDTSGIFSRYDDVKNRKGIFTDPDVPKGSQGKQSIRLTNIGGKNDGAHLYKMIQPGWDDSLFIRYYVKYPAISNGYIHHEAVKIGGNYPAIPYHMGQAGTCGQGDTRFSISYEPNNEPEMDAYLYWGEMRSWNNGSSCYGNTLVNKSSTAQQLKWDEWHCIEIMIKLNKPATARNGSIRIWQDGKEVGYWGEGFPNGHWEKDRWINDPSGKPFEGFQWRSNPLLNFNFLRIEHYDSKSPAGENHYTKYDHLVVAKRYIGPISEGNRRK